MKTRFLFPYWCKYLGVALFLMHLPVMLLKKQLSFNVESADVGFFNANHVFFIVTTLTMLSGLVLIAFSKERIEDEQITQLRMDSLQLAIYLNYIILIISLVFASRTDFWSIIHLNLWVPLAFFIILFRWKMYRNNRFIREDAA